MTPQWVFLNGRLVSAERAQVSVFDRGFLYGDALFETLRVYDGRPYLLDEHLARWRRSAVALGLMLPDLAWRSVIARLLQRNGLGAIDGWVRMTVTRGVGSRGLLPPDSIVPTSVVACGPLDGGLAALQRRGVGITVLPNGRHPWLAAHKTTNYLDGVLGKVTAAKCGCYEGIFTSGGRLTEGTTSNLFLVHDGRLLTPSLDGNLAGVTRARVIALARTAGIAVHEGRLSPADLKEADEVFLTSSLAEVLPVVSVDGRAAGDGRVGEVTRRLQRSYRQAARRPLSSLRAIR